MCINFSIEVSPCTCNVEIYRGSHKDYIDGYGAQPDTDAKAKGFGRMKRFFASDANDLGATVKEIAINVSDWNAFVIADRTGFEKNADVPAPQSAFDDM